MYCTQFEDNLYDCPAKHGIHGERVQQAQTPKASRTACSMMSMKGYVDVPVHLKMRVVRGLRGKVFVLGGL